MTKTFLLVAMATGMCMAAAPAMARSVDSEMAMTSATAIGDPGGGNSAVTQSYSPSYAGRTSDTMIIAAPTRAAYSAALIGLLDTKTAYADRSRQGLSADAAMPMTEHVTTDYRSPSGQVADLDMTVQNATIAGSALVDLASSSPAS